MSFYMFIISAKPPKPILSVTLTRDAVEKGTETHHYLFRCDQQSNTQRREYTVKRWLFYKGSTRFYQSTLPTYQRIVTAADNRDDFNCKYMTAGGVTSEASDNVDLKRELGLP